MDNPEPKILQSGNILGILGNIGCHLGRSCNQVLLSKKWYCANFICLAITCLQSTIFSLLTNSFLAPLLRYMWGIKISLSHSHKFTHRKPLEINKITYQFRICKYISYLGQFQISQTVPETGFDSTAQHLVSICFYYWKILQP